jgi:hypothetical protein
MHIFEGFLGGIVTATLAIIFSEIVFNYGLGDFLKDLAVRAFGGAKSFAEARYNRLTAKAAKLKAAL